MKPSRKEKLFAQFNNAFMLVICLVMIIPMLNVLSKSLSSNAAVVAGKVFLWPTGIHFTAYLQVFENGTLLHAFLNTVIITITGTAICLFVVITTGYALSKPHLIGRKSVFLYFLAVMFFNGGIIPGFLNVRQLGLYDTLWALILPEAMNIYFMILVKSFFEQLPRELDESASIDGCNDIQTLFRIMLPISKPIIATIGLFAAVQYWNIYIQGILYINSPAHYPLQVVVQQIIFAVTQMSDSVGSQSSVDFGDQSSLLGQETIRMAVTVVSILPIVCLYPFLQKYFIKGITLGSVKS